MPQDAFTLNHLCRELNDVFSGGKINKIVQPDNERIEFTVFSGGFTRKLVLDVKPSDPRIGITVEDRVALLTAPNFCMLLRKHLSGATIKSIKLVGFDRIVEIDCVGGGEFFSDEKMIFVELMGRYSNVILTKDGKVLGGNRGINFFDNGVRPLIVGLPYTFPPVGDKKTPDDEGLIEYFNAYEGGDLADYIIHGVQGVAKQTAEEALSTFKGEFSGERLFKHLKNFLYSENKNPCVLMVGEKVKDVFVFPYKGLTGELIYFPTLYAAEDYYFSKKEGDKLFQGKKSAMQSVVSSALKKLDKKLSACIAREKEALNGEKMRLYGELILANIYRIKFGDEKVSAVNYYNGTEVEIPLDANLSASQNAEKYYKKYAKSKRTLENVIPQKNKIQEEIDYLKSVLKEVELSETLAETEYVKSELLSVGLIKTRKNAQAKKPEKTKRRYVINGFVVFVGRNNVENDEITSSAAKTDIWLHVKDVHSAHVVIAAENKSVGEETIAVAAEICAYYSGARGDGRAEVVYTEKKNVKKPKGAKPGFFIYEGYSSIVVKPQKHEELLKKE